MSAQRGRAGLANNQIATRCVVRDVTKGGAENVSSQR